MTEPVRLRARDLDDLTVISALLQDSLVPLGDMAYIKEERRFVMAVNRYRWEDKAAQTRTHALVSFSNVDGVQSQGLDRSRLNHIYAMMSLGYADGMAFAEFSGGGRLRLRAESLDCLLEDVGEPWPAGQEPAHPED